MAIDKKNKEEYTMHFITYQFNGNRDIGILSNDQNEVIPLQAAERFYCNSAALPNTMLEFIDQGETAVNIVKKIQSRISEEGPKILIREVRILAPIPRPRKNIFCVGKNYVAHVMERATTQDVNLAVPKVPVIFSKPPTCVVGLGDIVKNHQHMTCQLDYEVELAVVIGKKASRVLQEDAYDYVFGYTIMNDVSARDLQKAHSQWIMGKGADTFAPLGPCIVYKSDILNPHDLAIKSTINGEIRQNANTKEMVFNIPTLIATLSSVVTLEPGDIIATGTPAGVGAGFNPPKFLQPGDEMRLEIEKIGILVNRIEQ
jgi:2-keto-4-pentenoate hydratase/2-oxohepta-3-ene-1,7-dioic acid hydratase in catechol pathway